MSTDVSLKQGDTRKLYLRRRELFPLLDEDAVRYEDFQETIRWDTWKWAVGERYLVPCEEPHCYVLSDSIRERLEEYHEQEREYADGTKVCPHCGYRGFSNARGVGGYRCKNDVECGEVFEEFDVVGGGKNV